MNRNPSPKSEFLKNTDAVKGHARLLDDPYFITSLDTALAEMQRQVSMNCPYDNFNACAAGHLRMLGAQDLVHILLNLAETSTPDTPRAVGNLPLNQPSDPTRRK